MSAAKECRICMDEGLKAGDEWISPCACAGTRKWVHRSCINEWMTHGAVYRDQKTRCEICRHEYRRRPRITGLNFPPVRTLLFLLTLGLAIRSHGALKMLAAAMCIALLEWLIDDWVRSALTGLYRLYFHYHAAPKMNWEKRVQLLAHIVRHTEVYHYVLKMGCVMLLGVMLPLRLPLSSMLAAIPPMEEASNLVEQASVYEWIIDNAV